MANLLIYVRGLSPLGGTTIAVQCEGRTDDMTNEDVSFFFDSNPLIPGTNATNIARAIGLAGIAAAQAAGRTVGGGDDKIVFGGPTAITGI
jgi:hypothetical protein